MVTDDTTQPRRRRRRTTHPPLVADVPATLDGDGRTRPARRLREIYGALSARLGRDPDAVDAALLADAAKLLAAGELEPPDPARAHAVDVLLRRLGLAPRPAPELERPDPLAKYRELTGIDVR